MNESLDLSIEPAADWHLTPQQRDRLTDLLDGYLSQLERGLPPQRENLIEANPDLAEPLRSYFQSLDELHDMAAGFQPPGHPGRPHSASEPAGPPAEDHAHADEKRLGDFRLLREVGRGGMGVVYEAEQISLGRRVALKVLPFAAVLDSRQIARFKHEAQAAGQLNHPNIVSVFAVGMERGVHYYAMQFIDGQPLDRVITEMRDRYLSQSADRTKLYPPPPSAIATDANANEKASLSVPPAGHDDYAAASTMQRSTLTSRPANSSEYIRGIVGIGIDAARALHAAHENGIVHRDVKPSNLLLDGGGKIWVTDFGLARRATDATLTRTGDLVGTIRYMSPEQAIGQMAMVDHRTDIYSLGATLYELLTLEPAMSGLEGQALLRQIERHDPRPPRQLQPKLPLDLQTVVMKGMSKRREDRYATAGDFADDLQRVLDGHPIVAHPPTLLDRAARWAQRHREIVAAAAAVCLLALVGLAVSTVLIVSAQRKTEQNLQLAKDNLNEVHEAVDKLGQYISNRLKHVPGATEIRKDVLRMTLRYYREFVEQDKDNPGFQAELALIYGKIGKLSAELGSVDDALEADQEAIRIYKALAEANPSDTEYPQRFAVCENNLGSALAQANKTAEARHAYEEAIRVQEGILDKLKDKEQCLTDLALARNNLGKLCEESRDFEGAVALFEQAKTVQEQQLSSAPINPDRMRNLAATLNNLGRAQSHNHDAVAAERSLLRALELQKALVKKDPRDVELQSALGVMYNTLGLVLEEIKRPADAAGEYEQAVEQQRQAFLQAPETAKYRLFLNTHYYNYGRVLRETGRADDALQIALARRDLWPNQPQELFSVARELALAASEPAVKKDGGTTAAEYGESAVETLKQAIAAGWKPKPDSDWMKAFAAIKNRSDFLALTN